MATKYNDALAVLSGLEEKLAQIGKTREEMDAIWEFMKEYNWKVKSLDECGRVWADMPVTAWENLIEQYEKVLEASDE